MQWAKEPNGEAERRKDMAGRTVGKIKVAGVVVALGVAGWLVVELARPDQQTTMPVVERRAVTIEPPEAPLGMLLHIEGHGLHALFEGQGPYGRNIYLVRDHPTDDGELVAKLRRGRITEDGRMDERAFVPGEFEHRRPGGQAPFEKIRAIPGTYRFAIDTPNNIIVGATFKLRPAEVGVAYKATLNAHCGIERFGFDGSAWLADPPVNDGQGNLPRDWAGFKGRGTFTLTAQDTAEFRSGNNTIRFLRVPPDVVLAPKACA